MASLRLYLYLHPLQDAHPDMAHSFVKECARLVNDSAVQMEQPAIDLLYFEGHADLPLNRSTCEALQLADLLYQRVIHLQSRSQQALDFQGCSMLIHYGDHDTQASQIRSFLSQCPVGDLLISETAIQSILKKSPKQWGCITLHSELQTELSVTIQSELESTAIGNIISVDFAEEPDDLDSDMATAGPAPDSQDATIPDLDQDPSEASAGSAMKLQEIEEDRIILLGPGMKAPSEARYRLSRDRQQRILTNGEQEIPLFGIELLDLPADFLLNESPSPHHDDAQRFGKYDLDYLLGRGGMGEVWLAKDRFGHPVAIKLMLSGEHASERQLQRFQREAKIMSNLQHRNICRIIEVDEINHVFYIAMEYVKGVSLSAILRSEPQDSKKKSNADFTPDTSKFLDRTSGIQEVVVALVEADEQRRIAMRQWEQGPQHRSTRSGESASDPFDQLSWLSGSLNVKSSSSSVLNVEDMMKMFDESIHSRSGLIEQHTSIHSSSGLLENPEESEDLQSIPLSNKQDNDAPASQEIFKKRQLRRQEFFRILPLQQSLALMIKTCQAVHFAHEHGVYHRDLKPGNLMLRVDGEPVVMDFGLAKLVDHDDTEASLSMSDQIFGTLDYMAPEQARSSKNVDERADVYSLGAILYQMITGKKQFSGTGDLLADATRLQTHEPIPPRKLNPLIDSDLSAILLKALRNDPTERYANVNQMAKDLENYRDGKPVSAKNPTIIYKFNKWYKRHAVPATISTVAVLTILILAGSFGSFAWWEWQKTWSGWKSAFKMQMTDPTANTQDLEFRIADNSRPTTVIQPSEKGLTLHQKGLASWIWLKDNTSTGDVRAIAVIHPESHGQLDMVIHGRQIQLPNDEAFPPGIVVSLDIGQQRSTLNLYRSETANNNAILRKPIDIPLNQSHEIRLERVQEEIIFTLNGKEILRERFLLPLAGTGFENMGMRSSSPNIYLESLQVYRKSQPEKASPLIAGDALVEIGQYDAAINKYLTIADDIENQEIVELALAKAFLVAARPESTNEALILELEKRIQNEFPDSSFLQIMKHVEIERLWVNGYYHKALDLAEQTQREGDERIASDLMKRRPASLPINFSNRLVELVAGSPSITNVDLSYLRGAELSPLSNKKFRTMDASHLGISDLTVFEKMQLEELNLEHNPIKHADPLKDSPLHSLSLAHTKVKDLNPISKSDLQRLSIAYTPVDDLSPLKNSPDLEYLNLAGTQVSDLSALKHTKLIELFAPSAKITSLEPLRGLPIEHVMLAQNQITDLEPLRDTPVTKLVLAGNPITSLEPLEGKPIRELIIAATRVESLLHISPHHLTHLAITGCTIHDIPYIQEFTNLQHLEIDLNQLNLILSRTRPMKIATLISSGQGIVNLTNVARHFPDMHILNLSYNNISNVEPLSRLELNRLNLSFNNITNINPLEDQPLRSLNLRYNKVINISPLVGMPLTHLDISNNLITSIDALKDSPLKVLDISSTRVHSLEALQTTNLEELYANRTNILDIRPLKNLKLRKLHLNYTNIKNINALSNMHLEELELKGLNLATINMLKTSTLYGTLNISGNRVAELSPLANMPLQNLYLNENLVSDISPLANLNLRSLDISNNRITSLAPLDQNPPQGFLFDNLSLSNAELQRVIKLWEQKEETQHHARNARVLLASRTMNIAALKKEATTVGDHQFLLIPKPMTWHQANAFAIRVGAQLANLQDKESNFAASRLVPVGFDAWFGLKNISGLPVWTNGKISRFMKYHLIHKGPETHASPVSMHFSLGFRAIRPDQGWSIDYGAQHKPFIIEWAPKAQLPAASNTPPTLPQ